MIGELLQSPNKYRIRFEKRPKKYKFGIMNYGEIPGTINPADGDPWDIIAPGYDRLLSLQRQFKIKKILGVLQLSNGNDKIAVQLYVPGYDRERAYAEIERYSTKYCEFMKLTGKFIYLDHPRPSS